MSARTVVFTNYKGGVGKTTCAMAFAAELGRRGARVMVIDLDVQGTATNMYNAADAEQGLPIRSVTLAAPVKENIESLKKALAQYSGEFDFIIIDTPGDFTSKGTQTSILMSDLIVIPTSNTANDFRSTKSAIALCAEVQGRRPDLSVTILRNSLDRSIVSKAIDQGIVSLASGEEFSLKPTLLKTVVRKNVTFNEAEFTGRPIWTLGKSTSNANQDAIAMTDELLGLMGVAQVATEAAAA